MLYHVFVSLFAAADEMVKESEIVEARKLKAKTIMDEERMMSKKAKSGDDAWRQFPEYLLVLAPTGEKEQQWGGLSGQISDTKKIGSGHLINCFLFKLWFFIGCLGPRGLEKLREICRKIFLQSWYLNSSMVPSYDPKT